MPARKIGVLINPASAGGRAVKAWPEFESLLAAGDFEIVSYTTSSETDFRVHARAFAGRFDIIGICGGDSSLTIAAEELFSAGFDGELVFLPAGSVNDIVLDIREQRAPRASTLWLGEISAGATSKDFIGQANWGLGVAVNRQVGALLHSMPFLRPFTGIIGFLAIVFSHLLRRDLVSASIHLDSETLEGDYSIILATQIRHWASGLRFAPQADWYAPVFEVVTIRRCSLVKLIRILLAARTARHVDFPEVEVHQSRRVKVSLASAAAVQVDGDILRDVAGELKGLEYRLAKKKSRFVLSSAR
ncbi:MAG: diacylglycerol kinase family protein [Turneriella sp.]